MDEALKRTRKLMDDIIYGKISRTEVEREIQRLENEFGEEAFLPYSSTNKKEKPWDKKYYEELKGRSAANVASKEFILHIAEVKEEVERRKKIKICAICGGAAAAVIIIGIIVWL